MEEIIGNFVVKYFFEIFLFITTTILGALLLKARVTYKKGQEAEETERENKLLRTVKDTIQAENKKQTKKFEAKQTELKSSIGYVSANLEGLQDEFVILKNGVLSTQGRNFRDECNRLLEEGHHITPTEFENLQKDHAVYNSLGGNSDGDDLYHLVVRKYEGEVAGY